LLSSFYRTVYNKTIHEPLRKLEKICRV
jgi:hypothetical protein